MNSFCWHPNNLSHFTIASGKDRAWSVIRSFTNSIVTRSVFFTCYFALFGLSTIYRYGVGKSLLITSPLNMRFFLSEINAPTLSTLLLHAQFAPHLKHNAAWAAMSPNHAQIKCSEPISLNTFCFFTFILLRVKRSLSVVNFKRHPAPLLSPLHRSQSPLLRSGQCAHRGAVLPWSHCVRICQPVPSGPAPLAYDGP